MFRAIRSVAFFHFHDRSDRNNQSVLVPHLEAQDIGWVLAELFIGLSNHLIGSPESIEIVHVQRSEIDLQGISYIGLGQAKSCRLFHIDVCLELRHINRKGGKEIAKLRRRRSSFEHFLGCVIERFVTETRSIFQLQPEPANCSKTLDWRWTEDREKGALNLSELLLQIARRRPAAQLKRH